MNEGAPPHPGRRALLPPLVAGPPSQSPFGDHLYTYLPLKVCVWDTHRNANLQIRKRKLQKGKVTLPVSLSTAALGR